MCVCVCVCVTVQLQKAVTSSKPFPYHLKVIRVGFAV